jgi:hypothetical protein
MFRHRPNDLEVEPDWFLTRVYELPVVNDAISQLSAVYSGVKERNRLLRFTLSTAESGVHAVVSRTVPPVVAKFEKPIGSLNTIACHQLDKLEHDYPIITRPSDEVFSETKQMCNNVVKPLVNSVGAVKQFGVDKVTDAKSYTTDKMDSVKAYSREKWHNAMDIGTNQMVTDAKSYTTDKMGSVKAYGMDKWHDATDVGTKQVVRVLDSPLCHEVIRNVNTILGVADNLVDKWLPEGVDAGEPRFETAEVTVATDESLKDHVQVLGKAAHIGNKVRRRMYARVANRMINLQLRTKETVERLNFTVDLIEYSRTSVTDAKKKAWHIWTEVNKTDEDVAKELTEGIESSSRSRIHENSTFERKAIATARHLTQKLKNLISNIGLPTDRLPIIIQTQLERARDLAESLVGSIPHDSTKEQRLPKFVTDNIRNYASLLLQTTSWMADWARQAPVIGRFMPKTVTGETVAEPLSTTPASRQSYAKTSRSRHDPSAVKEPAEDQDNEHNE